uniref:Uncharacterized protein n=1 Tax=Anguilla anguilla TaxID=7936 RepID=A0A0E9QLY7_ANGAN
MFSFHIAHSNRARSSDLPDPCGICQDTI